MSHKVINVDKEILGGTPVFWGTRVPIKNLFDYLEEGATVEEFLEDFPSVTREQVERVLTLQLSGFQKGREPILFPNSQPESADFGRNGDGENWLEAH